MRARRRAAFRRGDDLVSPRSNPATAPSLLRVIGQRKFLFAANYGEGTGSFSRLHKGDILPDQACRPSRAHSQDATGKACPLVRNDRTTDPLLRRFGIDTVKVPDFKDGNGTLDAMPAGICDRAGLSQACRLRQSERCYVLNGWFPPYHLPEINGDTLYQTIAMLQKATQTRTRTPRQPSA